MRFLGRLGRLKPPMVTQGQRNMRQGQKDMKQGQKDISTYPSDPASYPSDPASYPSDPASYPSVMPPSWRRLVLAFRGSCPTSLTKSPQGPPKASPFCFSPIFSDQFQMNFGVCLEGAGGIRRKPLKFRDAPPITLESTFHERSLNAYSSKSDQPTDPS